MEPQDPAEQGNPEAQHALGLACYDGEGVLQDYVEAAKWFRKAAEQGYAEAQTQLGVMYDLGQGVTQDYAEAVKWHLKAAEQGDGPALLQLSMFMFHDAEVASQDRARVLKCFRKVAERGNADAQHCLGTMYLHGFGVTRDYVKAHMWSNLAAAQGMEEMRGARDFIAERMTPAQVAEAQRLAREWLKAH